MMNSQKHRVWLIGALALLLYFLGPSSTYADGQSVGGFGLSTKRIYELPHFNVNLLSTTAFLQTDIRLEMYDAGDRSTLDKWEPVIIDKVIRILTSRTPREALSEDGKLNIKQDIIDMIIGLMGPRKVKEVYFITYMVQ